MFNKFIVFIIENFLEIKLTDFLEAENQPTFVKLLLDLCVCNILLEISSYLVHRLMHTKHFYKRFHKIHHEFKLPIPMEAMYNHPVEHVIMSLVPVYIGPVLIRTHFSVFFIWLFINLISAMTDHANIHIPGLKSPRFHNFHHENPSAGNFGITGLMDFVCGTDKHFRQSKKSKDHRVVWSFVSNFDEPETTN